MTLRLDRKKPLTVGNKTFHSADDYELTDFDLQAAQREINETDAKKINSLKKLKEMLSEAEHIVYCTDHDFLLRYLRVAKFDCNKAFKAVKKFYDVKKNHPALFTVTPQLEKFLELNIIRRLPYKNENGCFIFWIDWGNWNTQELSFDNLMQLSFSAIDILSMNPCLQVHGLIDIFDFKGMTSSHLTQLLQPSHLLLLAKFIQEIYPWRVNRVILLNFYSWLHAVYRAVRPLIKRKIAERIVILGSDVTELHQYVDPHLLPKEYGGCIDEKECSITDLIMKNLHFVEYQRSFGQVTEK